MKLSISNIAWEKKYDSQIYKLMNIYGFTGLEIAPTRIFAENPYDKLEEAYRWEKELHEKYGFKITSMQSIWYGRTEKLFGSEEDRKILREYTKRAIDFAEVIGCHNLVMGSPQNRCIPYDADPGMAIKFFRELGEYALLRNTVIGMEPNPPIYNTNYINDTSAAINLIKEVDSKGFLLNLDIGAMIENKESVDIIKGEGKYINHVHISEPNLKTILCRNIHNEVYDYLKDEKFNGYISIEMGQVNDISLLEDVMRYVKEVFADE